MEHIDQSHPGTMADVWTRQAAYSGIVLIDMPEARIQFTDIWIGFVYRHGFLLSLPPPRLSSRSRAECQRVNVVRGRSPEGLSGFQLLEQPITEIGYTILERLTVRIGKSIAIRNS